MNKTKHFKRTAFPLSAKSMVSLMLLLIAMLVPQGAWAMDFISEVKYGVDGNQNTAKGYLSGYTIIDHDFNNDTKGDWVYIGYKTSTNAKDAITGLLVVTNDTESNSSTYGDSGFKAGGAKTMMVDGKRYYLAEWGGYADMNHGNKTHKNPVYLYYTKDGNTTNGAQLITSLGAYRGELTANPAGLSVVPLYGGNGTATNGTYSLSKLSDFGDTNKGGGGTFNYITYTTHTHAYTAAFSWATNGKTCTATVSCSCGDTHSNLACTVTSAPKSDAAATCTVMGWTTYKAEVTSNGKDFSDTKDVQDIAALGHSYTSQTETNTYLKSAANCTADAVYYHKCSRCDSKGSTTWTKTGTALGHSYTSQTETDTYLKSAANCTDDAVYYHKCSRCTSKGTTTWTKTGTALGHDHSSKTTTATYLNDAATCTTAATYWYKCSRCDDKSTTSFYTSTDDKDKALNHIMTEHAAHDATCTEAGNKLYYTCSQSCCSGKYYKDNAEHTTNTYANLAETVIGKIAHN